MQQTRKPIVIDPQKVNRRLELLAMPGFVAVRFMGQDVFVFSIEFAEKFLLDFSEMIDHAKRLATGQPADDGQAPRPIIGTDKTNRLM